MSNKIKLDEIDRSIIHILNKNDKMDRTEIGKELKYMKIPTPASTIYNRLEKLKNTKIDGYSIVIDEKEERTIRGHPRTFWKLNIESKSVIMRLMISGVL